MAYLLVLLLFSLAQIALGLAIARRVTGSGDFFVAGRQLGPGLLFATMLAANIGAGSSVGAAGLGYRDGLSAWWWVGASGLGSIVLAFWIGPRIRAIAAAHDLRTAGDYLEWRFDHRVRATISILLWFGALAILAGQLVAMSKLMTAAAGWPGWLGCVIGGIAITIYSAAGGLKSSVWVNVVQLTVKLLGFAIALPLAVGAAHGLSALHAATSTAPASATPPDYWNFWQGGASGWMYLTTVGTSFIVSPGLLQKTYGARDDRAVRLGIGLNAVVLLIYAIVPVLLGMIARVLHPGLLSLTPADPDLALPMLLVNDLPPAVGMLTLAALFSAEMSAADAALFMLTTSLSQDLYRRFLNPTASDRRLLTVSRWTTAVAGTIGVAIAVVVPSVSSTLLIFYTLLSVSLFVPLLAGLYIRRAGPPEALAAIAVGVLAVAVMRVWHGAGPLGGLPIALWGVIGAAVAALVVGVVRPAPVSVNVKVNANVKES